MHNDEYRKTSSFYDEKTSIMNFGMEVKVRHFDYLLKILKEMLPNTKFDISV